MTRNEHLVLQLATALRTLPPDMVALTEFLNDGTERVWTMADILTAMEDGRAVVETT